MSVTDAPVGTGRRLAPEEMRPTPISAEVVRQEQARLALERRLVTAAGQANAAVAAMVDTLTEVLETGAWEGDGIRSPGHWLSWQASISTARAHALVRIARRLPDLPKVAAAFRAGELSESAATAIAKVGTPENEGELLHLARYGTISQLERTCSTYQKVLTIDDQERLERLPKLEHYLRWHFDDRDGALVLRARMDGDDGATWLKALEVTREAIRRSRKKAKADADAAPDSAGAGAESDADEADTDTADADAAADEFDTHDDDDGDGECYHEEPYDPMVEAFAELARRALDSYSLGRRCPDHHQVIVHISLTDLLAGTLTDDGAYVLGGQALSIEVARRLTCDSSVRLLLEHEGEPLDIGRRSQTIPDPMRRALERRDRHCRFPGCAQSFRLHGHHVIHWAKQGPTALWNLILLCPYHHKLVHEGGFDCRHTPDGVRFYRPNKVEVPGCPDPPGQRGDPPPLPLPEGIDHTTAACRWDGSPLRLGDAIHMLLAADGRLAG